MAAADSASEKRVRFTRFSRLNRVGKRCDSRRDEGAVLRDWLDGTGRNAYTSLSTNAAAPICGTSIRPQKSVQILTARTTRAYKNSTRFSNRGYLRIYYIRMVAIPKILGLFSIRPIFSGMNRQSRILPFSRRN